MKKVLLLVTALVFAFAMAACDPTDPVVEDITVALAGLENVEVEEDTVLNVLDGITALGSDGVDYANLITADSDDCTVTDNVLDTSTPGSCTIIVSVVVEGKLDRQTFDVTITAKPLPPAPDFTVMEWDFEEDADLEGWAIYTAGGGSLELSREEGAMKMVTTSGGQRFETRLDYMGVALEQNQLYKVSFKMKSDIDGKKVHLNFGELLPSDPWFTPFKPEGVDVITLTTEWQEFEYTFLMELDNQAGGPLFEMGNMEGSEGLDATMWVDDFRISGGSGNDVTDPTIEGTEDVTLFIGDVASFDPLEGVMAMDDGEDITSEIILSGDTVDVTVAGTYNLYYVVYDSAFNYTRVARTVVVQLDEQGPELSGVEDIQVLVGQGFDPLTDVMAMDNRDGDVTADIVLSGDTYAEAEGMYAIVYTVEDALGNETVVTRNVEVIDATFIDAANLTNGSFDSGYWNPYWEGWNGADAFITTTDDGLVLDIKNVGGDFWHVLIEQAGITMEAGKTYRLSFDAMSTVARDIQVEVAGAGLDPAQETVSLTDTMTTFTVDFTSATETGGMLKFLMGKVNDAAASVITLDNVMFEEFDGTAIVADTDQVMDGSFDMWQTTGWSVWSPNNNTYFQSQWSEGWLTYDEANANPWENKLEQTGLSMTSGLWYRVTFKAKGDAARDAIVGFWDGSTAFEKSIELGTDFQTYTWIFKYTGGATAGLEFKLGKSSDNFAGNLFVVDDVMIEVEDATPTPEWEGFGGTTVTDNGDGSVDIAYDVTTEWWWDFSAQHLNLMLDGTTFNAIDFTFTGVAGQNYLFKVEYDGGAREYGMAATGSEDVLTLDLTDLTEAQKSSINKVVVFANGQGQTGTVTVSYALVTIVPSTDTLADLPNQDFTDTDISGWGTEGTLTLSHDASGYLVVSVTELGNDPWSQNLGFSNQKVISGNTYEVTFVIKTEFAAGRDVTFFVEDTDNGYAKYFEETRTLTDSFQTFTFTFTPTADNSDSKIGIFVGNTTNAVIGNVVIDSITITETEPTT